MSVFYEDVEIGKRAKKDRGYPNVFNEKWQILNMSLYTYDRISYNPIEKYIKYTCINSRKGSRYQTYVICW